MNYQNTNPNLLFDVCPYLSIYMEAIMKAVGFVGVGRDLIANPEPGTVLQADDLLALIGNEGQTQCCARTSGATR
jgi:hypothetical protein